MKINIEVNSLAGSPVSGGFIKKIAGAVIAGEFEDGSGHCLIELSIALVSPQKIKQINKKYRKIDSATDVLSFAQDDIFKKNGGCPRVLGELIICPRVVEDDAKETGAGVKKGMAWVIIHGVLHLFGYDHEAGEDKAGEMRQKESFYLSKLKLF